MNHSSTASSTASRAFGAVAVACGVVFFFASFLASGPSWTRWSLAAAGALLVLVGAFVFYTIVVAHRRAGRIIELEDDVARLESSNQDLTSLLAVPMRSPLSAIIGASELMITSPDLDLHGRKRLLEEIRDNAREVDRILAELGDRHAGPELESHARGVVLLDHEVRSVINTAGADLQIDRDLQPSRAWADSALVREIVRSVLAASAEAGCRGLIVRTEERSDRATVVFSAREHVLPAEGIAALTGNHQRTDATTQTFIALRGACETASTMGGSITYAEFLGLNHVIVEFDRVPMDGDSLTEEPPTSDETTARAPAFVSAVDFRPERPTAALRFG